jgi:hypothetical protein
MNFKLQILLERTPLRDEDKHNISVIFSALSFERQAHILDHWEDYISQIVVVRKQIEDRQAHEFIEWLGAINTLLDEALIREEEKENYKKMKRKEVRAELESTVAFWQLQKLQRIKEISKIPN